MTLTAHDFAPFRKVLVPALPGWAPENALAAALKLTEARNIVLLGLAVRPQTEPLAFGILAARELRAALGRLSAADAPNVRIRARVTHAPWPEITNAIQQEEPDLAIIGLPPGPIPLPSDFCAWLERPPCDVALACGPALPAAVSRILAPVRGGPYAELAVRLALAVARASGAAVTTLHLRAPASQGGAPVQNDIIYRELAEILAGLPEVTISEAEADDQAAVFLAAAREANLVVMGSSARLSGASLGGLADRMRRESPTSTLLVRSRRAVPERAADPAMTQGAIALLVDKWLAENTYQAEEFADVEMLLRLKERRGCTISLALPALNEEATIGRVIRSIKSALYDKLPLLDEIILVDDGSTDRTREIAADLGVPVYVQQEILSQHGTLGGQGEALWKSLYLTRGDLVVWLDSNITHMQPRFVCGLLGPLLSDGRLQYVKGFGRRPAEAARKAQFDSEYAADLAVRPLLNLLYPDLSGVLPLLGGQCAGRRAALERLPFPAGPGVHPALLLEVYERYGLPAIAQVDLQGALPAQRSPESLAETTYAALQVFLRKLGRRHGAALVEDVNRTMKLVRADADRLYLEVRDAQEQVRPPMAEIPEYVARRSGGEDMA